MRGRVSQAQWFLWARPTVTEVDGEVLRDYAFSRSLTAAVYTLPMSERATARGIVPRRGLLLVLPDHPGLAPGDLLRPLLALNTRYRVTEVRDYPAHTEAALAIEGGDA